MAFLVCRARLKLLFQALVLVQPFLRLGPRSMQLWFIRSLSSFLELMQ